METVTLLMNLSISEHLNNNEILFIYCLIPRVCIIFFLILGMSSTSEDSQSEKPVFQVTPSPLPENLSPDVLNLVEQIKQTASVTENTRKTFCKDINNCLIK